MVELRSFSNGGKPSTRKLKNKPKIVRKREQEADLVSNVGGAAPLTINDEGEITVKDEETDEVISDEAEITDEATIIREGREAFERRKADARRVWSDNVKIGKALLIGHEKAKRLADGKTKGNRYSAAFHVWLKANGFLDVDKVMDKDDRAKLLRLIDNLDKVEAWRATKTEEERARWNHPSTVWREYRKAQGFLRPGGTCKTRRAQDGDQEDGGDDAVGHQDDGGGVGDGEPQGDARALQAEKAWDPGKLILNARKAVGLAKVTGNWFWPFPYLPDQNLIDEVGRAAEEWSRLHSYLKEEVELSPDEKATRRKDFAKTEALRAEYKQRKAAKRLEREAAH